MKQRCYAEQLETLPDLSKAVFHDRAAVLTARMALRRIRDIAQCQWGCVAQFLSDSKRATVLAAFGPRSSAVKAGTTLGMEEFGFGVLAQVRRTKFRWVEDMSRLPPGSLFGQLLRAQKLRAYLAVVLVLRKQLIGVLALAATRPGAFTAGKIEIAREQADFLALAIEHAELRAQVRANSQQLRILSQRLVQSQEEERRRIARELHDEIGQQLTALMINLHVLASQEPAGAPSQHLQESVCLAERMIQQVRELSMNLRPLMLDDLGLVPALRWHADRAAKRSGLTAHFMADPLPRLPDTIETACYRVAQEALHNVIRHARARHVHIELRSHADELQLLVRDDGLGFDVRAAQFRASSGDTFGLVGMEERVHLLGGSFKIQSVPQGGTRLQAHFPLAHAGW